MSNSSDSSSIGAKCLLVVSLCVAAQIWLMVCIGIAIEEEKDKRDDYVKAHDCKITATETKPPQTTSTIEYNDALKMFLPVSKVDPGYVINTWTCNDGNVYVR